MHYDLAYLMYLDETVTDKCSRFIILLLELLIVNALLQVLTWADFMSVGRIFWGPKRTTMLFSLGYAVCNLAVGVVAHYRFVRGDQILRHALLCMFFYVLLTSGILALLKMPLWMFKPVVVFYALLTVLVVLHRFVWRQGFKAYRLQPRHRHKVVFVGPVSNALPLFEEMTGNPYTGYDVLGYFADEPDADNQHDVPRLGSPAEAADWITDHHYMLHQAYCTLPPEREEAKQVLHACENHLVRFFVVPGVRNYVTHRMHFEFLRGVPVLSLRYEPLELLPNRMLKRTFDVLVAALFLFTLFPLIYIAVAIAVKWSSPGPVLFKQQRSGQDGRVFWCYKFRSMRLNKESDEKQATANDPRVTRVGHFIRRTNIDELPQFINVLRGEMSIVGPRPHMIKHTEQYSQLIDKYMVRHYVKPGITGWAQVSGFRGETRELWQMEGRVKKDIWYIEHWTLVLDLFIIYKTVVQMFKHDPQAY